MKISVNKVLIVFDGQRQVLTWGGEVIPPLGSRSYYDEEVWTSYSITGQEEADMGARSVFR